MILNTISLILSPNVLVESIEALNSTEEAKAA